MIGIAINRVEIRTTPLIKWVGILTTLLIKITAVAQERRPHDITVPAFPEHGFEMEFRLPDSLGIWTLDPPDWEDRPAFEEGVSVRPVVPMTSVVVVLREYLPVRTMILRNNTLRLGRYVVVSNGQAENWAPWPAGYLDARTISLPVP